LKPVILTGIAEADVERVAIWYEERKEGLGGQFVFRVRETIGRIAENPAGYAMAIGDVRVANLRQFPYGLWFRIRDDGSVVIGCLHGRRDRVLAKERAAGIFEMPKPKESA
jgi:plasmid stabilization system protein ParE